MNCVVQVITTLVTKVVRMDDHCRLHAALSVHDTVYKTFMSLSRHRQKLIYIYFYGICICHISIIVAFCFVESPSESLRVPDNSRHGSDGMHPLDQNHGGITNGFDSQQHQAAAADLSDCEVQEIFGNSAAPAAVQVQVEMNADDDPNSCVDHAG